MRLGLGGLTVVLALGAGTGCKCNREEPEIVGGSGSKVRGLPIEPPPHASVLPETRPAQFTVSFQHQDEENGETSEELLRLGTDGAFQSSERGGRKVKVVYSTNGPVLDQVYVKLREFACESVKTEAQRGTPHGGSMLKIDAAGTQYIVNDLQMFYPTAPWAGAYEGCSRAMLDAFPDPGNGGYAELDIRFEDFKPEDHASIGTDLGPDHRGLGWRDGDMTATLYVGKVRPVDIEIGAGARGQVLTIDLSKHSGVEIKLEAGGLTMAPIDGAARVKGTISPGPNKRVAPLGAPPKPPRPPAKAPPKEEGQ